MTVAGLGLVGVPQAPVPLGAVVEAFTGAGGARLRAAIFPAQGPVKGSVVLSPGRTEPIEKYFEVIGDLTGRGFVVLAHDWRGQGLSHRLHIDRRRGHCRDWRDYVRDHQALIAAFADRLPRPRIALAHSMGGCLVGLALPTEPRIEAALLSAPMFGVQTGRRPRWLVVAAARLMRWIGLGGALVSERAADPAAIAFEDNPLTHDRGRWDRHRAQLQASPDLAVGGITWGWLDNALTAMAEAARPGAAEAISIPLVIVGAGEEHVVVNAAARAFAERAPLGRYVEIPGSRHEIMMETGAVRDAFWAQFDALAAEFKPPTA